MKYCFDADSVNSNQDFIEKFEKIYEAGFPDVNEREDFQVILNRVGSNSENEPHSILLIHTNTDDSEVTGGLIIDWYKNSKSIHLIYLIISEKYREKGIAKELINNGVPWIKNWIRNEKGIEIKNVFFESNIPWKTNEEFDNFDAEQRLRIFSKMGAKLINIPYVQPALDKEKKEVENLFLLSFTQFNVLGDVMAVADITGFLKDFYKGLLVENIHLNKGFIKMEAALEKLKDNKGFIKLEPVPTELEKSSFEFDTVSVTCHFIEEKEKDNPKKKKIVEDPVCCTHFSSFEKDLLNFQNQKNQPFISVLVVSNEKAKLIFPKTYSYTSEGQTHTMFCERAELDIVLSVSYSQIHLSNQKIWHLTIAPSQKLKFTEYDIIKLSTLFGSIQENSTVSENIRIRLLNNKKNDFCLTEIIQNLGKTGSDFNLVSLGTGIVEIDSTHFRPKLEPFFKIFLNQERHSFSDEKIKKVAKAICGILLGIFDFNRMDDEEIFDTIQPIMPNELSLMVMCRGTLFKISNDDEIMNTVRESILISPYLLVPSAVLAHNEYLLTTAKSILTQSLNSENKIKLSALEENQTRINSLINYQYLEGLFQYPTENMIVNQGNIQRGLTFLKSNIEIRLKELSAKIESKRSNFALFTDSIIALVLFLIAISQFYEYLSKLLHFDQNLISILFITIFVIAVYVYIMIKKRT